MEWDYARFLQISTHSKQRKAAAFAGDLFAGAIVSSPHVGRIADLATPGEAKSAASVGKNVSAEDLWNLGNRVCRVHEALEPKILFLLQTDRENRR